MYFSRSRRVEELRVDLCGFVFWRGNTSGPIMLRGTYEYRLLLSILALAAVGAVLGFLLFLLHRWWKADAKRRGEEYFNLLAEAVPQIVWTAIPGGGIDYCNQRLYELTGFGKDESLGSAWQKLLHPDDLPLALRNWEASRQTGKSYDVEYRFRTAAGGYRWHLVRATPMRDSSGKVVKWFGACTDIDDQMRHQQVLEGQIKAHTEALMDANTRLQTEMHERALAQQELNLQSERMVRDLTKRSNRATNLAKMAELLPSCAAEKDACAVIAGMAPKVFPEMRGALLMFSSSRQTVEAVATWADCDLPAKGFEPQDCWALRTGHLHIVAAGDHTAECAHAHRASTCTSACLCRRKARQLECSTFR